MEAPWRLYLIFYSIIRIRTYVLKLQNVHTMWPRNFYLFDVKKIHRYRSSRSIHAVNSSSEKESTIGRGHQQAVSRDAKAILLCL